MWYLLAIRFEARLGEYLLQCREYVLVCARRGSCMLQASAEVVSEFVDSEAITRSCVVLELAEVRDGQPQMLAVACDAVLLHSLLKPPLIQKPPSWPREFGSEYPG